VAGRLIPELGFRISEFGIKYLIMNSVFVIPSTGSGRRLSASEESLSAEQQRSFCLFLRDPSQAQDRTSLRTQDDKCKKLI
jgi:hypothetical protein